MLRLLFSRSPPLIHSGARAVSYKPDFNTSRRSGNLEPWRPELQSYSGYSADYQPIRWPKWVAAANWLGFFGLIAGIFVFNYYVVVPREEGRPRLTRPLEEREEFAEKFHSNIPPGTDWSKFIY